MFRYQDWIGKQKQKCNRGFKTKREAKEYEEQFIHITRADMNMKVGAFVEIYIRDKQGGLKDWLVKNKRYMIESHILLYFEQKSINKITPTDIIQWQNKMWDTEYSQTYLRMLQNRMTALFTHASNIYNPLLKKIVFQSVKKIVHVMELPKQGLESDIAEDMLDSDIQKGKLDIQSACRAPYKANFFVIGEKIWRLRMEKQEQNNQLILCLNDNEKYILDAKCKSAEYKNKNDYL